MSETSYIFICFAKNAAIYWCNTFDKFHVWRSLWVSSTSCCIILQISFIAPKASADGACILAEMGDCDYGVCGDCNGMNV